MSSKDSFEAQQIEQQAKVEWETDAKVRAEFASFETYAAYRKAEAQGRFRILGKAARNG